MQATVAILILVGFESVTAMGGEAKNARRDVPIAVIVSLLSLAQQSNHPPVYAVARKPGTNVFRKRSDEHPEDESFPGLLLVRVEGRIYFGNAERVGDLLVPLIQAASPRVVVLDCSAIFDLEYSALKMLAEGEERIRAGGVELWLAALNPDVRRVVERAPLGRQLGHERMCFNLEDAVARFQARREGPVKAISEEDR